MSAKHVSTQFDKELEMVSTRVMELGGLVETQMTAVLEALEHLDRVQAEKIIEMEEHVNRLEVSVDHDAIATIARRQPAARDLRLLIAVAKATTDLERIGDESEEIACLILNMVEKGGKRLSCQNAVKACGDSAVVLLREALDAFARRDVVASAKILKDVGPVEEKFRKVREELTAHVVGHPTSAVAILDLMLIARAIERVKDHALNIAELTIYIVKGDDVRHFSPLELEKNRFE